MAAVNETGASYPSYMKVSLVIGGRPVVAFMDTGAVDLLAHVLLSPAVWEGLAHLLTTAAATSPQSASSADGGDIRIGPAHSLAVNVDGATLATLLVAPAPLAYPRGTHALVTLRGLQVLEGIYGLRLSAVMGCLYRCREQWMGSVALTVAPGVTLTGEDDPSWPHDVRAAVHAGRRVLAEEFLGSVFVESLPYQGCGPPERDSDVTPPEPLPHKRGLRVTSRPIPLSPAHHEFVMRELGTLEALGVIVEDDVGEFSTPMFCVDKDPANADPRKHYRMV